MQWDKVEVIHKEGNLIALEIEDFVMITKADNQANT